MTDTKILSGVLNNDDSERNLSPFQHRTAKNLRFYGGENGLTAENIKGNLLIANSNLPAGTNECIGSFYDQVKRRVLWFNYNSNTNHGIYQLLIDTGVITQIFRCGVNSSTDVLNFSLNYPICSASIVYRSEGEGDLLYWTDGTNRPKYLNLDTVSSLSPFTSVMLNAAKNAPTKPPGNLSFGDDTGVRYNAVKNKLFRFSYRWVYVNNEKSTFSPTSITPVPSVLNPNEEPDPTQDNHILFDVYAGDTEDNLAIEIFGQLSDGVTWGDFFLIDSLNLQEYNIALGGTYTYSFYYNGSYTFVSPEESDLYFDWLPDKANCLELLNGNVIIYGGITDGYPNLQRSEVDVQITSTLTNSNGLNTYAWLWGTQQRFGLVYFDERGKTNGVISYLGDAVDTTDFAVTTPEYNGATPPSFYGQVPRIDASINHTPPSWAVAYQWVRAELTPKFLHWVTSDYQEDANFRYFCIQNLIEFNNTSGFLPSYEFTEGDRLKVMANVSGNGNATVFSTQQDYPVLGVVDRVMTSPAQTGKFIKVPKLTTPSPGFTAKVFIQVYTPLAKKVDDKQFFFEWGQRYAIAGGYHMGQTQNQTALQPALFQWTDGDVYVKYRAYYATLPITSSLAFTYLNMMDANWNDYVPTASNSNGRGWVIEENADTVYNPVLLRWGGKYQQGTNLNGLNRFRPSDFDEIDRAKGDVRRMVIRERILRIFQDRGVGQHGVYARFIKNNDGNNELVTTNEIITTNNINYYQGNYGLSGYPTNLCSTPVADYFNDVVTGREIRLSGDGITDLGLLYKGQYTLPILVTPYNKDLVRSNGATAKVMKYWDSFENEAHTLLQAGTGTGVATTNRNYSFNETRNGFCCDEYDEIPEWALSADDVLYLWKDGQLYKRSDSVARCNFFGVQYGAEITLVFNQDVSMKKSWQSIAEVANTTWVCPVIYTDTMTYGSQRQETSLVSQEFTTLEGMPSASIKRDANSPGGKWNGDFMKGGYLVVKFQVTSASDLVNLSQVLCRFITSPLNVK